MTDAPWSRSRPLNLPVKIGGTIWFTLDQFQEICPGSPIGRTFTWEVEWADEILTFSGVPCVVDGDRISFVLDDSVLCARRPKHA